MSRTPGPWWVRERRDMVVVEQSDFAPPYVTDYSKPAHVTVAEMDGPAETWLPNAHRIVRAVNAHDALLEACEAAIALLDSNPDDLSDYDQSHTRTLIRTAIAKAKGVRT